MTICNACGSVLQQGKKFCTKCGTPVTDGGGGMPRQTFAPPAPPSPQVPKRQQHFSQAPADVPHIPASSSGGDVLCGACGSMVSSKLKFCSICGAPVKSHGVPASGGFVPANTAYTPSKAAAKPHKQTEQPFAPGPPGQKIKKPPRVFDGRERGGCLTAFLIWILAVNSLVSLYLLSNSAKLQQTPEFQGFPVTAVSFICLAQAGCAIALLLWKKFGFYGYIVCNVVGFIVILSSDPGNYSGLTSGVFHVLLLYHLVKPVLNDMD